MEKADGRARIIAMVLLGIGPFVPCHAINNGVDQSQYEAFLVLRGGGRFEYSNLTSNANSIHASSEATRKADDRITKRPLRGHRRFPGRRHRPLEYRDVLNCDARQWSWSGEKREDTSNKFIDQGKEIGAVMADHSYVDYRGRLEGSRKLSHSPVVYQYYGRSRIRGNPSDSVQFILLGPNVDHWKVVGQVLASRGFNTIACERLDKGDSQAKDHTSEDAPNLVLEVMDALKWKKTIIVGCDNESILAMETAMMLSPDQVVGLVLTGDLSGANQVAKAAGVGGLDMFLQRVLECPFLIVWDGDAPTVVSGPSAHKALEGNSGERCIILGGGSAPHRLKPEQFAWVLTRFVEEKLEMDVRKEELLARSRPAKASLNEQWSSPMNSFLHAMNLPFGINTLVSPEGRLLLGRAVAAALFYITAMRVILIQYGILRAGLIAIKSRYESIDALTKRTIQAVGSFIFHFGYIPRLFTVKRAIDDEEDENRRSGTIVLSNQHPEEEDKQEKDAETQEGEEDKEEVTEKNAAPNSEALHNDDDELNNSDKSQSSEEEIERPPLFKPFFFLDNVVT